jgi:hypothetical protein
MEQAGRDDAIGVKARSPDEYARLIRKLRWIGMEEEARRLEQVVNTLPCEQRGSVSAGPFSTD